MIPENVILAPSDRETLEKLAEFLPDKIFDVHTHGGNRDIVPAWYAFDLCGGNVINMDTYIREGGKLLGNYKDLRINLIMSPREGIVEPTGTVRRKYIDFLVADLEKYPGNVGTVPIYATDTRKDIEAMLIHPRIRGFKCYHTSLNRPDTWQSELDEYMPQVAWEIANERGMCITLHMVRDNALSDEKNLTQICANVEKYPNAKLILAHAARAFAPWTVEESVEKVAKYSNVYFDFSAVCEPVPFMTILKAVGHKRVMWGSDFPVSMYRGKCVSIGSTFLWLYREQLEACSSKTNFNAQLVGVENLMAMRTACKLLELTREQVEDIFYNNAMDIFGFND